MYGLYKDPDGEYVFSSSDPTTQHRAPATVASSDLDNLKRRIMELEVQVAKQQVHTKLIQNCHID